MRTLTWKINGSLQALVTRAHALATLQRACDAWQKAAAGELKFICDASQIHPADIHFEFGRVIAEYGFSARRTIQRQGGGIRHIVTFSDHVTWNACGWWNRTFGSGADLLTHALHQLGAVLGLAEVQDRETSAMLSFDPLFQINKNRPDSEDAAEPRSLLLRSNPQSWRD